MWESERTDPERNGEDKEKLGLTRGWAMFPLKNGQDYQVLIIRAKVLTVRKLGLGKWWS